MVSTKQSGQPRLINSDSVKYISIDLLFILPIYTGCINICRIVGLIRFLAYRVI